MQLTKYILHFLLYSKSKKKTSKNSTWIKDSDLMEVVSAKSILIKWSKAINENKRLNRYENYDIY